MTSAERDRLHPTGGPLEVAIAIAVDCELPPAEWPYGAASYGSCRRGGGR